MKTYLTLLLLFFCSFLYAGTKEEITTMLQAQNEAWNKGDLDAFLKPYDPTDRLVFMGSSGPVRSLKVLKEHYESRYKKGENDFGKLTFSELEVEELSSSVARAWGKWMVEQKDKKPLSGWFSLILNKTNDGWKIIHDHSS
jgi:beta-aspartyl-peptidase (threonine type)